MRSQNIAVLGAGIAGLAAASLLRLQNHRVTLFESFAQARPVGSGLLLQLTGLAVLAQLGLDRQARDLGASITRFEGQTAGGKTLFDLAHTELAPNAFSLGIHRHSIFTLLYQRAVELGVTIVTNFDAVSAGAQSKGWTLHAADEQRTEAFDLIVDASGAKSRLRDAHARVRRRQSYSHGALWGVGQMELAGSHHALRQRFHRAEISIGLFPIGRTPETGEMRHTAFHWSMRHDAHESWCRQPYAEWVASVARLWPETEPLLASLGGHQALNFARYSDIVLARLHEGRLVFIGDAAHAISPRLGQGANLGLVDAWVLSECLAEAQDVDTALACYGRARAAHVRYYHHASRWLSVFFQSDHVWAAHLRDAIHGPMCRLPLMRRQMLQTIAGLKTGLFSALDPGTLHADYALSR